MEKLILAKYDVSGIQDYIFATNRLLENVGASYNVSRILKDFLPQAMGTCIGKTRVITDWADEKELRIIKELDILAEIIYIGGGNAFVLYKNREIYNDVSRQLAMETAQKCQGVTVFSSFVETEMENYFEDDKKLEEEMAALKRRVPRRIALSTCPLVEQDTEYGMPITKCRHFTDTPSLNMSTVQYEKYQAACEKDQKTFGSWDFSNNMEDFIWQKGEDSYVAVVHIDGNGMGGMIKEKVKECKEYMAAVTNQRSMSAQIAEKNWAAYKEMMKAAEAAAESNRLPFRPLIREGDDLTFICGAQYGLPAVLTYLRSLLKNMDQSLPYSACAGIAFVHSHFPFRIAYQIAEECCANAKKRWYADKEANQEAGYLDYHIVQGTYTRDMKALDKESSLKIRPLRVSKEVDLSGEDSFDRFYETLGRIKNGEKKWSKNRLEKLYKAYLRGPEQLELIDREFSSRGYRIADLAGVEQEEKFDPNKAYAIFDALEIMDLYDRDLFEKMLPFKTVKGYGTGGIV